MLDQFKILLSLCEPTEPIADGPFPFFFSTTDSPKAFRLEALVGSPSALPKALTEQMVVDFVKQSLVFSKFSRKRPRLEAT